MKTKITTTGARAKLIARLSCMTEAVDDLETEIETLTSQREECCYPVSNGITVDDSFLTVDAEFITVDPTIP
jgi:hypothetical protein